VARLRRIRRVNAALILQCYISSHALERELRAHVLRSTIRSRLRDASEAKDAVVLEQCVTDAVQLNLLDAPEDQELLTSSKKLLGILQAVHQALVRAQEGTGRSVAALTDAIRSADRNGVTVDPALQPAREMLQRITAIEELLSAALDTNPPSVSALTQAIAAAAEEQQYTSPTVTRAKTLRQTLVGESEARAAMNSALLTPSIEALKGALAQAKTMNLLSDPKAVECEQLLNTLLEHERLRTALTKALNARDEAQVLALLERANSAQLIAPPPNPTRNEDESVIAAQRWLKQIAAARARIAQLVAAKSAEPLPAALTAAIELGLELDQTVVEAQHTLKAWNQAVQALRAAIDAQPRTLAVFDAALQGAVKAQLNEGERDWVEAKEVRAKCAEVETGLQAAVAAKDADSLSALLKQADSLRYSSGTLPTASQLLLTLTGESEARAAMQAALQAGDSTDSLRKALEMAKAMGLSADAKAVECEQLLAKLIERERMRAALAKAVAAKDEAQVTALLTRATAVGGGVELNDSEESVSSARLWLKQLAGARKRLAQLIADSDAETLPSAIASAVELGLEFDPSVSEAQGAMKLWKDAKAVLRAAIDLQPLRTLASLDAAIERAAKCRLNTLDPDWVEANAGMKTRHGTGFDFNI
jgi:hypothetical protein